ncbi:MAG TPA: hypothetical protein PLJ21_11700, partial [Pseudobdellovibrionaceae bacterium]|nr:hypothetical protein [Pseudobdellovibrionaceae bacterium]
YLHYWLREGKASNSEVDYIIEKENYLIAVEVKAGAGGKIRSLHQWMNDITYKKKRAVRFNLSKGAIERVSHQMPTRHLEYDLMTLPLYLIQAFMDHYQPRGAKD